MMNKTNHNTIKNGETKPQKHNKLKSVKKKKELYRLQWYNVPNIHIERNYNYVLKFIISQLSKAETKCLT